MKTTKRSMLASGLCLLLSVALLMGATFAWFTDSVTNTGNTIQAGNLDVGFQYRGLTSSDAYQDVPTKEGEMGKLFVTEGWEPGRSQGLDLKVSNNGSLALKWQLYFTNVTCTGADIADVLDVYVGAADAQSVEEMTMVGTLSQVAANSGYVDGGELTAQNGKEFSVVLKMQEGAGNDYQGATVTFDVELRATQATVETDGFGNSNYDAAADGAPDQDWGNTISGSVTVNKPDEGDAVLNISGATVTVPAEAIDGDSVTLKIAPATTPEGVTVAGKGARTYAITLEGVKEDNTTPISVSMYVGTGLENVQVYQGTQEISATYDSASGYLQFSAVSFDLLTVTYDVPWNGEADEAGLAANTDDNAKTVAIDTPAQLAAFAQKVNSGTDYKGYTVTLTQNLDLGGVEWTPIGGSNTGKKFAGTFDGQEYTISNLKITRGLSNTAANNSIGLFGACTNTAKLQNFTLNNVDVSGSLNVGAVLGGSGGAEAKITNVHVTGSVKVYGYWYVGGIMGKGYTNVTDSSVEGDGVNSSYVSITGGYVGGIVGFMGEGNNVTTGCRVENLTVSGAYNGIGGINGILHYGNTISDCTVNNVVVWETTQEDTVTNRVYAGAFAGTFLDNGGKNCPTLRRCEFTGEIYSGEDKTDVLEANRYVGSLWYGAEVPATVNIEDCVIHMP